MNLNKIGRILPNSKDGLKIELWAENHQMGSLMVCKMKYKRLPK